MVSFLVIGDFDSSISCDWDFNNDWGINHEQNKQNNQIFP